MKLHLPYLLQSCANMREFWAVRAKRVKAQRSMVLLAWKVAVRPGWRPLPCVVTLTRVAPRELDSHDNLRSAFKATVDQVAAQLGVDDRDPRVEWRYQQRKGKPPAVVVEIEAVDG